MALFKIDDFIRVPTVKGVESEAKRAAQNQVDSAKNKVRNIINDKILVFKGKVLSRQNSGTGSNSSRQSTAIETMGSIPDGDSISNKFVINISSSALNAKIIAFLQDKVALRVTSEWESFEAYNNINRVALDVAQFLTKKALLTKASTRRIWRGTSPIEMTLTIKFQSYRDAYNEVVRPVHTLMQMVLPGEGGSIAGIPLLSPPGPNPYTITDIQENLRQMGHSGDAIAKIIPDSLFENSDIITIDIGTYMHMDSVIIKDVNPSFDNKLDQDGYPISADVQITFQTYEILTKQSSKDLFQSKNVGNAEVQTGVF